MRIAQTILFLLLAISLSAQKKPNVILIFVDDLGYGDLGCFGHPIIKTPNLDKIAQNGAKLTSFYAAANVCSPSRAALMTGRLPIRSGMIGKTYGVLFPFSTNGLPKDEITLPEVLKPLGYSTGMVGKWHMGYQKEFLPTNNGFDSYYGIPYSNDMGYDTSPTRSSSRFYPKLYMLENEKIVEEGYDQTKMTKDYTSKVVDFIEKNKSKPFFMYYAPNFPHVPLYASKDFLGKSKRGLYGDVVEELDWSVGKIMETLKKNNLEENTLVIFTSDNGPWTTQGVQGGSAGLLKWGKGSCWEGGMRVPAVVQWPGKIAPNQTFDCLSTTMDLFTTIIKSAGGQVPSDRVIDGNDLMPVWTGKAKKATEIFFYYHFNQLFAVRKGAWKMHLKSVVPYVPEITLYQTPLLYNLENDPSEQYNVAAKNQNVIKELQALADEHIKSISTVHYIFDDVDNELLAKMRRN
jgi:arylsulfatase A-like enzyme